MRAVFILLFVLSQSTNAAPANLIYEFLESSGFKQTVRQDNPDIKKIEQLKQYRTIGGFKFRVQWQKSKQDASILQADFDTMYKFKNNGKENHQFLSVTMVQDSKQVIKIEQAPTVTTTHKHKYRSPPNK